MNWNQYSDSDDEWLKNSDEQQQQQDKKQELNHQSNTKVQTVQSEQKKIQEVTQKKHKKEGRKYPTDKQLLQSYQGNKIEEKRRIKVTNCKIKEEVQMLKGLESEKKLRGLKCYLQNCYIVKFWTSEDLIKFIKEKIEKNYKFHINEYVINEKQRQFIAEKQKERSEIKAKQEKQKQQKYKQQRQNRQKNKKTKTQYRQKNQQQNRNKEQIKKTNKREKDQQHHDQGKHREQRKHKTYPAKNLQLEKNLSNNILVLSDQSSPSSAVEWIKNNKITIDFQFFTLIAPGRLLDYVQRLCEQINKTLKFGLTTEINQQEIQKNPEESYKFKLQQGKQPLQRIRSAVYIKKVDEQNFKNVEKHNIHIIGDKKDLGKQIEFNEKEYIDLFKKNYQRIVNKWGQWVFYAYEKNIPKLLRLSGVFKKQILPKNQFKYQVGICNKLPFIKFSICDLNKNKFKPDTSVINRHIQDQ